MLRLLAVTVGLAFAAGCAQPEESAAPITGGANLTDRSNTVGGEKTTVGSMSLSPDGKFVVLHDATKTTIVDLARRTELVRSERWDRVVFGADDKERTTAYVSRPGYDGLVAVDLESGEDKWKLLPAYYDEAGAQFFRLAEGGKLLLAGDVRRVFRIEAQSGNILGTSPIGAFPQFAVVSPTGKHLFVVSETKWTSDDEPRTPFTTVDIQTGVSTTIEIPNCAAPPAVLPDDSRVLVSPTFCQRGASFEVDWQASARASRGVDPVSVIEVTPSGEPVFRRNLPGFGPVTLSKDGKRAVAFLDTTRIDEKLFDDRTQVPTRESARYQLMWIDPRSERFTLQPIGSDLPRFAFSVDGTKLLVDSTVLAQRQVTLFSFTHTDRGVSASFFEAKPASSFLGFIDVESRAFRAIEGPRTSLDGFVQLEDGRTIYALTSSGSQDGRLRVLDLDAATVREAARTARDLALLPDGRVVLRSTNAPLCVTRDGDTCE